MEGRLFYITLTILFGVVGVVYTWILNLIVFKNLVLSWGNIFLIWLIAAILGITIFCIFSRKRILEIIFLGTKVKKV